MTKRGEEQRAKRKQRQRQQLEETEVTRKSEEILRYGRGGTRRETSVSGIEGSAVRSNDHVISLGCLKHTRARFAGESRGFAR